MARPTSGAARCLPLPCAQGDSVRWTAEEAAVGVVVGGVNCTNPQRVTRANRPALECVMGRQTGAGPAPRCPARTVMLECAVGATIAAAVPVRGRASAARAGLRRYVRRRRGPGCLPALCVGAGSRGCLFCVSPYARACVFVV
jgi:hypothetical protein